MRSQAISVRLMLITWARVVSFGSGRAFNGAGGAKAELWARWQKHDPASTQKIDHSAWDGFLKNMSSRPIRRESIACGIKRSPRRISRVCKTICSRCRQWRFPITTATNRKPIWINVYNALTIDVVLSRFPVASIRNINISPGLSQRGPWGAKLFIVEGEKLSLDDIEHRILRPIWKDNRVHYAVNDASLGLSQSSTAGVYEREYRSAVGKGRREFINHPRGVDIQKGKLQVSSIYVWFQEDFGRDAEDLMEHWQQYANPGAGRCVGKIQRRLGA